MSILKATRLFGSASIHKKRIYGTLVNELGQLHQHTMGVWYVLEIQEYSASGYRVVRRRFLPILCKDAPLSTM